MHVHIWVNIDRPFSADRGRQYIRDGLSQMGNTFNLYIGQHGGDTIDRMFLSKDPARDETFTCYTVSIIYSRLKALRVLNVFGGKHSDMSSDLKHWSLRFICKDHDVIIDFGAGPEPESGVIGCRAFEGQTDYGLFKVTIQPIVLQSILYNMRESGYGDSYSSYSRNCHHFAAAMVQEIFSKKYCCKIDLYSVTSRACKLKEFDLNSTNKFAIFGSRSDPSS